MTSRAKTPAAAQQPRTVIAIVEANPVAVFQDEKRFDDFLAAIKAEIAGTAVRSIDTAAGRADIVSLAFKCTKAKTALDAAGKRLGEDLRDQLGKIDVARRRIRTELDALANEVRRPVTEWEAAEDRRAAFVNTTIMALRRSAIVEAHETSATVFERLERLSRVVVDEPTFMGSYAEAHALLDAARAALTQAHARLLQSEADAAELARLRRQAEEREAQERERQLQAQRAADEKHQAEQRAANEAVAKARAEEQAKQRERDLAAAREQAAKDALARSEEAARLEALQRQREETARAADAANRKRVTGEIIAALDKVMKVGKLPANRALVQSVALALTNGDVPHCKVVW